MLRIREVDVAVTIDGHAVRALTVADGAVQLDHVAPLPDGHDLPVRSGWLRCRGARAAQVVRRDGGHRRTGGRLGRRAHSSREAGPTPARRRRASRVVVKREKARESNKGLFRNMARLCARIRRCVHHKCIKMAPACPARVARPSRSQRRRTSPPARRAGAWCCGRCAKPRAPRRLAGPPGSGSGAARFSAGRAARCHPVPRPRPRCSICARVEACFEPSTRAPYAG